MRRSTFFLANHLQLAHGCAITTPAHTMLRTLFTLCFLTLGNSATLAEAVPPEFVSCSRIQKSGERLACYDRAVAYLSQPNERQTAAPSAETSFGLQASVPQPPAAATKDGANEDEISSIQARVTELSTDREGKKVVTLDNGQVWRELSKSSFVSLKVGDEVTITRAALGSFRMAVPNGQPLRVRRVR
jgi:hypothetical protein